MIEVYLKHRPNKPGYTEYWKEIFSDTTKYKVYELTEEDRPNCVSANMDLYKSHGPVFASHATSFLHSTTDYHWAIDSEDIKFEEKITIEDIRKLFERIENDAIENNLDGYSYDMYLSILGGVSKQGPGLKMYKDMIPHWTFGMAFLKRNNNILDLLLDSSIVHRWNVDWRMSELKYINKLNLKTYILLNATVHHTWGDVVVREDDIFHGGDPNNPPDVFIFPIKPEVIQYQFEA